MKNTLKFAMAFAGIATLSSIYSPVARATDLLNQQGLTVSSTTYDDKRTGRVKSEAALPSWLGVAAYPGATTTGNAFSRVFSFSAAQLGAGNYVEITITDPQGTYVSAFTGAYNPTAAAGTNANFLGSDLGAGQFNGVDTQYFQAVVPASGNLIVVVTDSSASGTAHTFGLSVANYTDVEYTDVVPEPSTWAMLVAGALLTGVTVFRRRRANV